MSASKGGAPTHPDWYHNLLAYPIVTVEANRGKYRARAIPEANGPERDRLFAQHIAVHPGIGEYPKKTSRTIPMVVLERLVA